MTTVAKYKDKRTAADRKAYFQEYHAAKKLAGTLATAPKLRAVVALVREQPKLTLADHKAAWARRARYLEQVGGHWPQRAVDHPESIAETLRRVK